MGWRTNDCKTTRSFADVSLGLRTKLFIAVVFRLLKLCIFKISVPHQVVVLRALVPLVPPVHCPSVSVYVWKRDVGTFSTTPKLAWARQTSLHNQAAEMTEDVGRLHADRLVHGCRGGRRHRGRQQRSR